MPFKNRIRLPLYIKHPQFPSEANRFRLANGATKTLSVVIRKTFNLVTDYMPARMHQRLVIALNHDEVNIEGDRYVGGVAVDGEYKIEWPDFLDYPLGQAEVQIQVTPFAATNDNCQTCEEISQISLVDDTIASPINEGADGVMEVIGNDSICCFPITLEVMSFNTTYVSAASINEDGIITVTIKNPAPSGTNVLLATYRVTCPNGGYDEANVYGTVVGSETPCEDPTGLAHTNISPGDDEVSWVGTGDFEWQLYTCDNLGTPIQTGVSAGSPLAISGLSAAQCYTFSIRKDCGGGSFSEWVSFDFTPPASALNCGEFTLTNNNFPTTANDPCSYMNCAGVIASITVITTRVVCMLVDEANQPIYFTSLNGVTTFEYEGPCPISGELIVNSDSFGSIENITDLTYSGISFPVIDSSQVGTWENYEGGEITVSVQTFISLLLRFYLNGSLISTVPVSTPGDYGLTGAIPEDGDSIEIRLMPA